MSRDYLSPGQFYTLKRWAERAGRTFSATATLDGKPLTPQAASDLISKLVDAGEITLKKRQPLERPRAKAWPEGLKLPNSLHPDYRDAA